MEMSDGIVQRSAAQYQRRMWRRLSILALLLPLALPARAAGSEDVARGKELALRLCASCHMNPGQGEKAGADGIPGFAAVARRPQQSVEGLVRWLRSVPPMMPNHHLTQDEMYVLAAFILSLKD